MAKKDALEPQRIDEQSDGADHAVVTGNQEVVRLGGVSVAIEYD